ncbi:MAG: TonB-dependent receptor [Acidobacteriota bacterium]
MTEQNSVRHFHSARSMAFWGRAWIAPGVILLSCFGLFAQTTGTVRGRVADKHGAPLPGVTVTVRSEKVPSANSLGAVTDARGRYRITNLPPGNDYALSASFPGLTTVIQGPIQISTEKATFVDFILVEELVETIRVEAQGSIVDTTSAATSTVVSEEFIESLPILGRNYTDILTLAPGVTDTDGDGRPNVHGAREVDFQIRLGGVNITDPFTGNDTSDINIEAIQEVQMITAGANAEYGRAQGGFGTITTKSGGNEFSGSFKVFYQTSSIDGDGAHNQDVVKVDEDPASFRTLKPFLTVGGAIRRDRLWYFLANQYIDQQEPWNILGLTRNWSSEGWNEFGKLTWQINPSHKVVLEALYDPRETTGNLIGLGVSPDSDYWAKWATPVVTARGSWVVTPTVLLESAISYLRGRFKYGPVLDVPDKSLDCPLLSPAEEALICGKFPSFNYRLNLETGQVEGPYWIDQDSDSTRFTLKQDMSFYVDDFLGNHNFKVGYEFVMEDYDTTIEQRPLRYDFGGGRPGSDVVVLFADFEERVQDAQADIRTLGVYLQDSWSIRPNLTLNLGVRIDHEKVGAPGQTPVDPVAERAEFNAQADVVYKNFRDDTDWKSVDGIFRGCTPGPDCEETVAAPGSRDCDIAGPDLGPPDGLCNRWDRIAISRIFTRHEAEQATSAFFTSLEQEFKIPPCGSPERLGTCRGDDDVDLSNTNLAPRISIMYDPFADGKTKLWASWGRFYDRLFLAVLVPEQARDFDYTAFTRGGLDDFLDNPTRRNFHTYTLSRDLRTPYTDEFVVGFERELSPEFALSVRYIRRKGRDQIQVRDINHFTVDTNNDGEPDDEFGEPSVRGSIAVGADGFPDLYAVNPFYGGIFFLDNFNTSDYRGFEINLVKRLHRNWQFDASYTYSEAVGDAEAFESFLGGDTSQVEHEFGFLSFDQRHVVKFNAIAHFPKQIQFGTRISWASGLPFSLTRSGFTYDNQANPTFRTIFPTGQRNDQRNNGAWLIDVSLGKQFTMGNLSAGMDLTVTNLLNSDDLTFGSINSQFESNQLGGVSRRFGRRLQLGFTMNF